MSTFGIHQGLPVEEIRLRSGATGRICHQRERQQLAAGTAHRWGLGSLSRVYDITVLGERVLAE